MRLTRSRKPLGGMGGKRLRVPTASDHASAAFRLASDRRKTVLPTASDKWILGLICRVPDTSRPLDQRPCRGTFRPR